MQKSEFLLLCSAIANERASTLDVARVADAAVTDLEKLMKLFSLLKLPPEVENMFFRSVAQASLLIATLTIKRFVPDSEQREKAFNDIVAVFQKSKTG